jgi:hypothetical protein
VRRLSVALVLCSASWGTAAAASLDAKPGLWERTVVTLSELAPTGPKPDLSKLAPEQRKKLEQVMSGSATTSRRTRVTAGMRHAGHAPEVEHCPG